MSGLRNNRVAYIQRFSDIAAANDVSRDSGKAPARTEILRKSFLSTLPLVESDFELLNYCNIANEFMLAYR